MNLWGMVRPMARHPHVLRQVQRQHSGLGWWRATVLCAGGTWWNLAVQSHVPSSWLQVRHSQELAENSARLCGRLAGRWPSHGIKVARMTCAACTWYQCTLRPTITEIENRMKMDENDAREADLQVTHFIVYTC